MRFNPESQPDSAADLIEGLARNGREAAIIREYGHLTVDAAAFLDEPLSYLLDDVVADDKSVLSRTIKALDVWGEQQAVPVTACTALALSSHGLVRIRNIGYGAVGCLDTYVRRYSSLRIPRFPEPEFAAYFAQSLKQIPAHTVTADSTDATVRLYEGLTMADIVPPPSTAKGPDFISDTEILSKDYVRGYRRRFALSKLVYAHLADEA